MSISENIGRYRVERRLGAGAFATVWLAEDDLLDTWVAVKVLADNWSHHPDIRERFTQEARIMRRADSDRLVRVLDIGELADGRPFFVMTYASGGTLADRLVRSMPVERALRTAADIARAVAVLHDSGVLHRDLKPSNILFDAPGTQGRVLVADLGLAKSIAHASGFTVVAGTPGYMAPEQSVLGQGLDVRADVYAIGALTYHMLTGRVPGAGVAAPAGLRSRRPVLPPPSEQRPGVPARVDEIVLRAVQRDPRRRWPSAASLAAALDDAADASARAETSAGRVMRRLRRALAVPVLIAALLGCASSVPVRAEPPGWVRVGNVSGVLSIAVPRGWAKQIRDSGWNPGVIGLPPGEAAGFVVATDVVAWNDPRSDAEGVFMGVSRYLGRPNTTPRYPRHSACSAQSSERIDAGGLTGRKQSWTGCAGTSTSFHEVVLARPDGGYGVYLQIKQVDSAVDPEDMVDTLQVGDELAAQAAERD